jgi:hypothetical protein
MQISTSTRLLIKKRKRLRTLWLRTHDITLRPLINSLKQEIDSAIKDQISNFAAPKYYQYERYLENNQEPHKYEPPSPPLKHNGNIATTNQEKVNMFADTLEKVFTANPDVDTNFTVSTEQVVTTFLKQPVLVGSEFDTRPATRGE